ncbi:MAG: beta-ketoacyl synthase N-terminal-like domain-containing protein [Verrucomicrobiota bacterium]
MELVITSAVIAYGSDKHRRLKGLVRDRKILKALDDAGKLLLEAGAGCFSLAGIDMEDHVEERGVSLSVPSSRWPEEVSYGGEMGGIAACVKDLHPLWILKCIPNIATAALAIETNSQGVSHTTAEGGWEAMRQGVREIMSGRTEMMLCGEVLVEPRSASVLLLEHRGRAEARGRKEYIELNHFLLGDAEAKEIVLTKAIEEILDGFAK